MTKKAVELLKTFSDEEEQLGQPVAVSRLHVPKFVWLESDRITYRYTQNFGDIWKTPLPRILGEFLDLRESSDAEVLHFVELYGPLMLCKRHALPWTADHLRPFTRRMTGPLCWPDEASRDSGQEPTARYRELALDAFRLLHCAVELRQGSEINLEDWPTCTEPYFKPLPREATFAFPKGSRRLAMHLNWWLWASGLRPAAGGYAGEKSCRVDLYFDVEVRNPLFAVISLQLVGAISGGRGTSVCSECGQIYIVHRRLAEGRSGYCAKCGLRAAWRRAQQKARVKIRQKNLRQRTR
jgi:hypothetical protein